MYYVVTKLPVMHTQMSFEDFLNGMDDTSLVKNSKEDCTRTEEMQYVKNQQKAKFARPTELVGLLKKFNEYYKELRERPRDELYRHFKIPKRSGGLRQIDAPNEELSTALTTLKSLFEDSFGALYHTNAFAYIKNRSTIDAVKRHQRNDSYWFAKYDLSNFFGSTTKEYVMKILSMIYPFSHVIAETRDGKEELEKALDLAFLNGGLPQGTPLSPMLTNIIMIPVDFKLSRTLNDFGKQHFVYTRYADDFLISSHYDFDFKKVEKLLVDTLAEFGAPFTLNTKKTRYGSRKGSNWILGVMLNSDNNITVGYQKKKQFQNMLSRYAKDKLNGVQWELEDVQHMEGLRSYYRMVEGETIDKIVEFLSNKHGVNIMEMIKTDLQRN